MPFLLTSLIMRPKNRSLPGSDHLADRIEAKEPKKAAEFMILAAHPDISIRRAAKRCGIPERTARNLYERLRTEYLPVLETLRKYQTKDFLELVEDRLGRALEHLTDDKLKKAEVRDLGVAIGILVEKRQLLRGEPTSILSVEDRRQLSEILPLIFAEARRRGETIELEPGEFSHVDGSPAPSARVRSSGSDTGEPIQEARQRGGKILREARR